MESIVRQNPNQKFIFWTSLICLVILGLLILSLNNEDINTINIVTIIGTIVTVGGLIFAIREQYKIKKTSEAIQENTEVVRNSLMQKSYELHITNCLKFISNIQNNVTHDPLLLRVHVRLLDLSECLIECKKLISSIQGQKITSDKINKLIDYTEIITGYCTQIQLAKFDPDSILDKPKFISDINEMQNFLNEIREKEFLM